MWRYWIQKVKEVELDGIQTWIVSNLHGFLQSQGSSKRVKRTGCTPASESGPTWDLNGSLGAFSQGWYLIQKAKEGELDAIHTYDFWNLHGPPQGQGGYDLVGFIKEIQPQGL
ncbi:uncharacterized protein LOC144716295 isoform X2 [Wolffia australiana]